MKQCKVCKEFFNPESFSEVCEHTHNEFEPDKEYYGKQVKLPREEEK